MQPVSQYNLVRVLLYLLVSTRGVIGQFSGPYSPARPANFFLEIYHQIFLTYIASKSLKLFFTSNCVLKRAND